MPKRGENIYHRKDGRWEGRYIKHYGEDGHASYASVYGRSYAEVKGKLAQHKQLANTKSLPVCRLTVNQLLTLWLAERQPFVKASTHARYTALVRSHLVPDLGELPLQSLTAEKLDAFIAEKQETGRLRGSGGLSPKSIVDILFVLRSAMKLARRRYGFVDRHNLMDVQVPSVPRRHVQTFGELETARMSQLLARNTDISCAAFFLVLNTGLRLGEVCALRWEDIDCRENEISISRAVQRIPTSGGTTLIVQSPKSDSSVRTIPLPQALIHMLAVWRKDAPSGAYILTGTERPMEPRTMQYRFQRFLKQNGFQPRNFHVMRHSFASRCIAMGMEAKCLSEILGHANVKTTLQLYVHPSKAQKRAMMKEVCLLQSSA